MEFEDTFYGRENTIKTYKSLFKYHIKPHNVQLSWFDLMDEENIIRLMVSDWRGKGLSSITQSILLQLFRKYVKFLGGPNLDIHRFSRLINRSEQQKEITALTPEGVKSLIAATKNLDKRLYPVLLLGLHAGLRTGEIFGLRKGDIDLKGKKIKVSHSYDGPTKNGRSRIVPMSNELFRVFSSGDFKLDENSPGLKVFKRFDPSYSLHKICDIIKLKRIRFHDLRHTFASMALNSGVSPKVVATWLGHISVATTLNTYWNLTQEKVDLGFLSE